MLGKPALRNRILALAAALLLTPAPGALAQQKVGVNSAVNADATGTPPGGTVRKLVIGQEVVFNEHITTGPLGQTQLLFLDESAMSVGPNSDLTIDQFVYDPNASTGKLAMSATRGVMRFVGGKLSKQEDAVTVRTPSATVAVRGGVFLMNLSPAGQLDVVFVFGKSLTITGLNGAVQSISRPGFAVTVAAPGASPSAPVRAPAAALAQTLAQIDGRPGGNGGATQVPTDTTVANSPVPATVSGNVAVSVQQATAATQVQSQTPAITAINPTNLQTAVQVNTVQNQGDIQVQQSAQCATSQCTSVQPAPAPTPVQPVAVGYAGFYKTTPGSGSSLGFTSTSSAFNIPYTGGQIGPDGFYVANLAGSTIRFPVKSGGGFTQFDPSMGTQSPFGPISGTSFISADSTFLYSNNTEVSFTDEHSFVFGGLPVQPAFYAPTTNTRLLAFQLQPDAALQSGVPFIRNAEGGSLANPSVSPLYLVAPANTQFGSGNVNTNPGVNSPKWLQASIAVNGQGTNQNSALVINTGNFFTSSDTSTVVGSGPVRASSMSLGSRPTAITAGSSTVPDGNNNNLFGSNTLTGFVLDQNGYTTTDNFQNQLASIRPSGGTQLNYAFTQPAVTTALPNGIGTNRTSQSQTGFFGGIMYPNATGAPYALSGVTAVATDATNNRVFSIFGGNDPFTQNQSGIQSVQINFGSLNGSNFGRSTFIDDANFAAAESPSNPTQVNGANTQTGLTSGQPGTRVAMVTSDTAPLPSGFLPTSCACQFMKWGYWTGEIDQVSNGTITRFDRAGINFWTAGVPTVTLPTTGSGTYNGTAVGSVNNNGLGYIAAGNFTTTYNFGSNTGTVAINNFDGRSLSGTTVGTSGIYVGNMTGTNLSGQTQGRFFGPNAVETGGNFAFRATAGNPYTAAGIFYAR